MKRIEDLKIQEISDIYIVSNTPAYLYKKLRNSHLVDYLYSNFSSTDLSETFHDIACKQEKGLRDIVLLYAILSAFSLKSYSEAKSFFESTDLSVIEWGNAFKNYFLSTSEPIKKIYINVNPEKVHLECIPVL